MPAKNSRNPTFSHGPSTTWRDLAKVSHPRPENLCRQARLFREHAGVVQVLPRVRKLFFNCP